MSAINSVGSSSSSSNTQAVYQEYLARLQAQTQAKAAQAPQTAPAPVGDVDHDGDSK